MFDALTTRLEARVPDLQRRLWRAGDFSALLNSNEIGKVRRGAYVLATALRGGDARAATGAFVQDVTHGFSVILTDRAAGALDARAADWIDDTNRAVCAALLGWVPPDEPGPVQLASGQLLNVARGVLVYELKFTIQSQLRITP